MPLGRRASVGTNRFVTRRTKRLVQSTIHPTLVLFCFNRAKLTGQVATGLVRRIWFAVLGSTAIFAHQGGHA
jgi:hypothetical protein